MPTNTKPDRESVRAALAKLRDAEGFDAVREVLKSAGGGHDLSDLPETKFAAVIAAASGKGAVTAESDDGFSKTGRLFNAAGALRNAGRARHRGRSRD